jgi:hypothetical protein
LVLTTFLKAFFGNTTVVDVKMTMISASKFNFLIFAIRRAVWSSEKRTSVDPNTQEIQGTSKNETLGSDIVVNSIGSNIFG